MTSVDASGHSLGTMGGAEVSVGGKNCSLRPSLLLT